MERHISQFIFVFVTARVSQEEVFITDYRAHAETQHTLFTPCTSQTPRGPTQSPRITKVFCRVIVE